MMQASAWLVVLVAITFANLPFLNQRLFALVPLRWQSKSTKSVKPNKPIGWRLAELGVLYWLTRLLSYVLEARLGNVFAQGWQFYAITFSLFLVLAFPGFVFCYLVKRS